MDMESVSYTHLIAGYLPAATGDSSSGTAGRGTGCRRAAAGTHGAAVGTYGIASVRKKASGGGVGYSEAGAQGNSLVLEGKVRHGSAGASFDHRFWRQ